MFRRVLSVMGLSLALLARPCCLIPMGLSIFGASSSGLVQVLHPYRWYLLASCILSFSLAGFFTLRAGVTVVARILFLVLLLVTTWILSLHW